MKLFRLIIALIFVASLCGASTLPQLGSPVAYSGGGGGAPAAPTNVLMPTQGGSGNTNTAEQSLSWTASAGATSYNIYRCTIVTTAGGCSYGSAYANTTGTSYNDTGATNSFYPASYAPAVVYSYAVTAVSGGGESTKAYPIYYMYNCGVSEQGSATYSYGVTENFSDTAGVPACGSHDYSVIYSGSSGAQPYTNSPMSAIYAGEVGGYNYFTVDVKPASSTTVYLSHISRPGGTAGTDVYPTPAPVLFSGTTSAYGTVTIGSWTTLKVPLSALGMGISTISGYITSGTMTQVSVLSGPTNVCTGGAYVYGNVGIPGGTYINSNNPPSAGPYPLSSAVTVGSSLSPVTITCQRTNMYKIDLYLMSGSATVYYNNIGWTVN